MWVGGSELLRVSAVEDTVDDGDDDDTNMEEAKIAWDLIVGKKVTGQHKAMGQERQIRNQGGFGFGGGGGGLFGQRDPSQSDQDFLTQITQLVTPVPLVR
jgi:hypothetical protein